MEARLQKWGNSNGIRIPSSILKSLNLKTNDLVELKQVDDTIVISKSNNKKIILAERFEQYNGKNLSKDFIWDEPEGNEIW